MSLIQDPAPAVPFSHRVREATRAEHSSAETRGFISRLMGGELTEADYWRLLGQYLPVYEALETRVRELLASDEGELLRPFHDARLERTAAIRADLRARFGSDRPVLEGTDLTLPLPATKRYAARIREADAPRALAHHYLRYLGDLSGGQAIGALVSRHYGIPRGSLTMWDFSAIDSPKRVKDAYRAHLDDLAGAREREIFLDECRAGYVLAGDLFEALEG